jgi:hemoglobin-like flavoprotein
MTNSFNASDADKVRESFVNLLPKSDAFSMALYQRLFAVAPETRALFTGNIDMQREKLIAMLALVVRSANNLDALMDDVRELGRRHVEYGVSTNDYVILKDVFVDTLAEFLGDDFNADTRRAWSNLYDTLANAMTGTS